MNKSKTLTWNDHDNADSYLLCLEPYGLKLLLAKPISEDETEITVYGAEDDVNRLLEDLNEDAVEPLESMSASLEDDADYEGWLNNEVWWMKQFAALDSFEEADDPWA